MSQEPSPTDEIAALRRELEELVSCDVNDEPDDIVDSILGRGLEIINRLRELGEKV